MLKGVVTIKVERQNVPEFFCTLRADEPLQKLMESYCDFHGLKYKTLRFTLKGQRVRGQQTVRQLRLKNGSVIDAWIEALGGGAA